MADKGLPSRFSLIKTKKGNLSLRVRGEDGSIRTLHSLYDPEREAETLVGSFSFSGRGILVVLGLGLAYHLKELSSRFPQAKMVVIEASRELYEIVKNRGGLR